MRALTLLSVIVAVLLSVSPSAQRTTRPDLSGYWGAGRAFRAAEKDPRPLPPNTVLLTDAGAPELAAGNYGGLKVKPAALAAAQKWKPADEMTLSKACQPPSLVYTMQGPFPMEIDQATELIVMRLEYYDLFRVIYLDGRAHPPADAPHSKMGHSTGRWDGATLVVDTTHIASSTITNNGLDHGENVHFVERFWLSADGKTLMARQEFEDPDTIENRGARLMAWDRQAGEHIYPYECDPTFVLNYGNRK
ncbi:MAG TPA: hypothetical protein VFO31_18260 [Vicinamibacterales bacterium]|nr:hypothetical protein [Vicinamibacterales bacterium]